MNYSNFLEKATALQEELVSFRRYIHANPGVGFDIADTVRFVKEQLIQMGYAPKAYGKAGLMAICGRKEIGKTILLRADMDALPICEESGVPFASHNGMMHACGHDMHTAMLLGAAKLLKEYENELSGTVVLCFQPSEENFEGAKDMIEAGILKDTSPDAALMLHVTAGMPFETGTAIVCSGGVSAPAADYFTIDIQGKGCHGSMPQLGVDPITTAAHIITALQEIHARELSLSDEAVLTIGSIHAGNAYNAIPDTATLGGTIRTYDEDVRTMLKQRMEEIVTGTALVFRANATLTFGSGCPTLQNNPQLSKDVTTYCKELLGQSRAFSQEDLLRLSGGSKTAKATGSEDFAYFSHEIPSIMLAMAAGKPQDGYQYPQHHPKVTFDENALSYGSAVYAYNAMRWLEEHV